MKGDSLVLAFMSLVKPRIMLAAFLKPVQSTFESLDAAVCCLNCWNSRTGDEMVLCPEQLIVADDLLLQMGWIHLPDWVQNMDLHIV